MPIINARLSRLNEAPAREVYVVMKLPKTIGATIRRSGLHCRLGEGEER